MSASVSRNTASFGAQRTIPRASGVSNGRLHERSADERQPATESQEELKSVAVVGRGADLQGFGHTRTSFELFGDHSGTGDSTKLRIVSKEKSPYSPDQPHIAKIDLLA